MPELPEVECTAQFLRERVLGLKVKSANFLWARTLACCDFETPNLAIAGKTILEVERKGKYIVVHLGNRNLRSAAVLVHLRMSGSIDVLSSSIPLHRHDRANIALSNDKDIRFCDPRKFGKIYIVSSPESILSKLGPDPTSTLFTWEHLYEITSKKKGAIKPLLLNQGMIAGIGNIYADESLWRAKIHPLMAANRIKPDQIKILHVAIRKILLEAIELNGTDNGDNVVEGGAYRPRVYGRTGRNCGRCKSPIQKMVVAQRGTHFCPSCQIKSKKVRRTKNEKRST